MNTVPEFIKVGAYVTRGSGHGTSTVHIFAVDDFRIHYDEVDGVIGYDEATRFTTLAEAVAGWRPATADEIARYNAHARPWYPVQ